MENDSVRTSGTSTLVDMWIDGKFRTVAVTRAAIEAHLRLSPERAEEMSDDDRREFVRSNLRLLAATAGDLVRDGDPDAAAVVIDAGHLGGQAPKADRRVGGDRRRGGDRRKANLGPPPTGERRRGSRDQRGS